MFRIGLEENKFMKVHQNGKHEDDNLSAYFCNDFLWM
jgi:hypothetical protein